MNRKRINSEDFSSPASRLANSKNKRYLNIKGSFQRNRNSSFIIKRGSANITSSSTGYQLVQEKIKSDQLKEDLEKAVRLGRQLSEENGRLVEENRKLENNNEKHQTDIERFEQSLKTHTLNNERLEEELRHEKEKCHFQAMDLGELRKGIEELKIEGDHNKSILANNKNLRKELKMLKENFEKSRYGSGGKNFVGYDDDFNPSQMNQLNMENQNLKKKVEVYNRRIKGMHNDIKKLKEENEKAELNHHLLMGKLKKQFQGEIQLKIEKSTEIIFSKEEEISTLRSKNSILTRDSKKMKSKNDNVLRNFKAELKVVWEDEVSKIIKRVIVHNEKLINDKLVNLKSKFDDFRLMSFVKEYSNQLDLKNNQFSAKENKYLNEISIKEKELKFLNIKKEKMFNFNMNNLKKNFRGDTISYYKGIITRIFNENSKLTEKKQTTELNKILNLIRIKENELIKISKIVQNFELVLKNQKFQFDRTLNKTKEKCNEIEEKYLRKRKKNDELKETIKTYEFEKIKLEKYQKDYENLKKVLKLLEGDLANKNNLLERGKVMIQQQKENLKNQILKNKSLMSSFSKMKIDNQNQSVTLMERESIINEKQNRITFLEMQNSSYRNEMLELDNERNLIILKHENLKEDLKNSKIQILNRIIAKQTQQILKLKNLYRHSSSLFKDVNLQDLKLFRSLIRPLKVKMRDKSYLENEKFLRQNVLQKVETLKKIISNQKIEIKRLKSTRKFRKTLSLDDNIANNNLILSLNKTNQNNNNIFNNFYNNKTFLLNLYNEEKKSVSLDSKKKGKRKDPLISKKELLIKKQVDEIEDLKFQLRKKALEIEKLKED